MDALELSRCELLRRINATQPKLDSDEASEEPEELRNLKEQYSGIIYRIEEANPSPLGDPLEKLPVEIWQDIISECCFDWRDMPSLSRDFDQLLTFTLVSRKWSEFILSTPILWSEIVVYSDMADLDAKLVTWLTLSRDLPLHVNFEAPIPLSLESLKILQGQSHRIRTVRFIRLTLRESNEQMQRLIDMSLVSLGDLPLLEAFVYKNLGSFFEPDINPNHIKHIRTLYGVNPSRFGLFGESMQNLRSIYTQQLFTTLFQSLSTLPSLKAVSCDNFRRYSDDMGELPLQSIKRSDLPIDKTPLPWLHLGLLQRYVDDFSTTLDRIAPTLLELEVRVTWGDLEHFLSTCGRLRRLQELKVELPANTLGANLSPLNNTPTTNVRLLNVYLGDYLVKDGTNPHKNDELRNNIKRFFEALPSFGPKIARLCITTRVLSTPPLLFVQRMPHLREVDLVEGFGGSFQPFEILLPNVEKVYFGCRDSSWALSISCPNAIRLDVSLIDLTDLKFEGWYNIQHLEISSHALDWENISLPYLQKLVLHEDPNFFSTLALHPTSFPRLTHIHTNAVPEWDILFIMLERRNFLTDKSILQIRTIGLPCLPHITILRPLCDRLRGVFSDRPSNFALSTQSIAPIYMDIGINGCDLCQRSFLPCDSPTFQHPDDDAVTEKIVPRLSDYPNTPEEILFTTLTRRKEWNKIEDEFMMCRYDSCESTYLCPTEITGYTSISLPIPLISL